MDLTDRKMPWWLMVLMGLVIIGLCIFFLVDHDPQAQHSASLSLLLWVVGIAAAILAAYNLYLALKFKDDNKKSIPCLVHGLLDVVLLLLLIVINDSPNLLGTIIASWLIVFGVFEVITARHRENAKRTKLGSILVIIGLIVLIIPLTLKMDYVILIGVIGIVFGVASAALGIYLKMKYDQRTSGGRSNLI